MAKLWISFLLFVSLISACDFNMSEPTEFDPEERLSFVIDWLQSEKSRLGKYPMELSDAANRIASNCLVNTKYEADGESGHDYTCEPDGGHYWLAIQEGTHRKHIWKSRIGEWQSISIYDVPTSWLLDNWDGKVQEIVEPVIAEIKEDPSAFPDDLSEEAKVILDNLEVTFWEYSISDDRRVAQLQIGEYMPDSGTMIWDSDQETWWRDG